MLRERKKGTYYDKHRDELLEYQNAYNKEHPLRHREFHDNHPGRCRKKGREKYARNKDSYARTKKEYREKNPMKLAAGQAVRHAIQAGKLKRGPCEVPGCKCKADAHHDSYAKEHWLDVRWLCRKHHKRWHADHPEVEEP